MPASLETIASEKSESTDLIALITGAASGIGRGVVRRFLDGGWTVVAVDRSVDALEIWRREASVIRVPADITDAAELDFGLAKAGIPSLRASVNVAGVYPPSTFLDFTEQDYRLNFDVNVLGTMLVARAALPYLREASGPRSIVNFASTGAYAQGDGLRVLYKASKAAVVSLTRSMAFELGPEGIQVNGIAPGPIETEGSRLEGNIDGFSAESVPLGRLGTPADMAEWVWALAGDAPLPFATGETIVVSGGRFMR